MKNSSIKIKTIEFKEPWIVNGKKRYETIVQGNITVEAKIPKTIIIAEGVDHVIQYSGWWCGSSKESSKIIIGKDLRSYIMIDKNNVLMFWSKSYYSRKNALFICRILYTMI